MTITKTTQIGKEAKPVGVTPAVALVNPKFPHNVGQSMRAASCFGVNQLWFTGDRVSLDSTKQKRLPREERMKGYASVDLIQYDKFFDMFPSNVTPVAVEVRNTSELSLDFEHPENPLYVFGPEDGSIPGVYLQHCHRFVVIPTAHCANLSAAVYLMLYDRMLKRHQQGIEVIGYDYLKENRGYLDAEKEML